MWTCLLYFRALCSFHSVSTVSVSSRCSARPSHLVTRRARFVVCLPLKEEKSMARTSFMRRKKTPQRRKKNWKVEDHTAWHCDYLHEGKQRQRSLRKGRITLHFRTRTSTEKRGVGCRTVIRNFWSPTKQNANSVLPRAERWDESNERTTFPSWMLVSSTLLEVTTTFRNVGTSTSGTVAMQRSVEGAVFGIPNVMLELLHPIDQQERRLSS